ncbi:endo-1,4-beta-xylanase [Ruminiclostridium sufflavum DSM 19573]|uniref:Beta-xylanase n=1 Tax=Ruminiclostridium sufflavum DSM 19573 TaxID=1121337 RepID=A0A318XPM6_9FIRM|nr:endo-1,4-beta-xylanase [Ruminiclostridium sufflavum]PYG90316.1 endo-1,4-beta-xylanase [Ruminiclostridium sufflavum DSM 19573]
MQCSKIFKRGAALILSAAMLSALLPSGLASAAGMSSGEKFLGNIIASSVPADYDTYWNQVTPENASKWGSAEPSRDSFNWGNVDLIYNYAKSKNMPFKFHTLVWGSQEPGWIGGLSQADQKAEVLEWIQAAGKRYPDTQFVDVVNEPLHAPASYRNAIGGAGTTGWDWIIWSFEQARQAFPNSKLLINEYGIISDVNATNNYLTIINLLKARGLVDGIGIQCHNFNMDTVTVSTMNTVLNKLSATGLPIYVSELDMTGDENTQMQRYKEKFPVFWENPNVKGVTLWGYVEGKTWRSGTGILNSNNTERAAMKWLKEYMSTHGGEPEPAFIYGDLNGDKAVDAIDNAQLKQYLLGQISDFSSKDGKLAADLDKSGTIDALDLAIMKKYLLKIITTLPV